MSPEAGVAGAGDAFPDVQNQENMLAQTAPQTPPPNSSELSISSIFGLLNIFVGLMLVLSFLLFFGGLVGYLSRLGLDGRTQGLIYMYRGVSVLFVLVLVLTVVKFVQFHTAVIFALIAIVVVIFAVWVALQFAKSDEEEEH